MSSLHSSETMKEAIISPMTLTQETKEIYLQIYQNMCLARGVDLLEEEYTSRGEAFFQVSGTGHEAVAALAPHLISSDYLHCHYRDKALLLARGVSPEEFFNSLFCNEASHSKGRQMSAHISAPHLNILSIVGPVGNNALQAAGVAHQIKNNPEKPLVLCAMGDGTTQQGEVLEALAEASRSDLPMLFLIEDNKFAISTDTGGKTFLDHHNDNDDFMGIPIIKLNGKNTDECFQGFKEAVNIIRGKRQPVIIHLAVDRLCSHTNADDQTLYRPLQDIENARKTADPIALFREFLIAQGISKERLEQIENQAANEVRQSADKARRYGNPAPCFDAKKPLSDKQQPAFEYRGKADEGTYTMLEAMREVLRHQLIKDPRITLYGEDLEDPKGDVFGLTRSLSTQFPDRVINSPLSESTILGVSIGRAMAGAKPVAFLQFADFMPLALNQIISEMASLYWRTDGGWQCPVVVMVTCGGYRPGLGPFHAQTFESLTAHVPGLDVVMPSNAADAAGLLNSALESDRPTIFFYPKSLLNDRSNMTSADVEKQFVPLGRSRTLRKGDDLTLVTYGNGVALCQQAADLLEKEGFQSEIIDLRTMSPWDEAAVLNSARKTGKLFVVHEDSRSGGFGAEVASTVAEKSDVPVIIRRIARADTWVPCNYSNQLVVMPSLKSIIDTVSPVLGLEVTWKKETCSDSGIYELKAYGSSPADEKLTITDWYVKCGDTVQEGQILATVEADKASMDVHASVAGTVTELAVETGSSVLVGEKLITLKLKNPEQGKGTAVTTANWGIPQFKKTITSKTETSAPQIMRKAAPVGIAGYAVRKGSRVVTNEDIIARFPDKNAEDIASRTGILSRNFISDGESALSLAADAVRSLLRSQSLELNQIDLVLCSTGTPEDMTPSLACRLLYDLDPSRSLEIPAYDFSAACSGYLYALSQARDYLNTRPDAKVLVVTSEVLSPQINWEDFNTAILFGDAATATLILGESQLEKCPLQVEDVLISAQGESGNYLRVPKNSQDKISMQGLKVFSEGVRKMELMMKRLCNKHQIDPLSLDWVIPHQANQRIIDAIQKSMGLEKEKVYSNIQNLGNTSSNTIPLALDEIGTKLSQGQKLGLCAFGGGFTYASALLKAR